MLQQLQQLQLFLESGQDYIKYCQMGYPNN